MGATDIHLLPEGPDVLIQFRIADKMYSQECLPAAQYDKMAAHFKFLAGLDIGEKRRPQSGSFSVEINNRAFDLRVSSLPSIYRESIVLRLMQERLVPLLKLSLFPADVKLLGGFIRKRAGLLILTGPTGSGKTTTLYTLIEKAQRDFMRKIITLEDPVEKKASGVLQVQINEKAGITYAAGLKAALRHDPDLIMVGEIRDAETAAIAVRAALTGHLVMTTMHTKNTAGALNRLIDFGIPKEDLKQTLIAVTAQRLVDLECRLCRSSCSVHCRRLRPYSRAGIYEMLYGKDLENAFRLQGNPLSITRSLANRHRKAFALGFISAERLNEFKADEYA